MLEHKPQPLPSYLAGEEYSSASSSKWSHASSSKSSGYGSASDWSSGYRDSSWSKWRDQHTSDTGTTVCKNYQLQAVKLLAFPPWVKVIIKEIATHDKCVH